jgi:hypothetical protein
MGSGILIEAGGRPCSEDERDRGTTQSLGVLTFWVMSHDYYGARPLAGHVHSFQYRSAPVIRSQEI